MTTTNKPKGETMNYEKRHDGRDWLETRPITAKAGGVFFTCSKAMAVSNCGRLMPPLLPLGGTACHLTVFYWMRRVLPRA